jgi:CRP-like cAMP-binding protein
MISSIKELCSQPKGLRSEESVLSLCSLLQQFKVFSTLLKSSGLSSLKEVSQLVLYEFISNSSFVFRFGDIGTRFYTIIDGRVSMQVPNNKSMQEVMVYSSGSSFGEIALEAYKTRGASAYCLTDCHFICLEKKDYLQYMQRYLAENKQEIVDFLKNLPFFNQMSIILLKKLTYNIKEVLFKKGQIVFQEGDEANFVFILRTGECHLDKLLSIRSSPCKTLRQTHRVEKFTAKTVGPGAMIGEEAVLNNLPYNFSCIVSSESAVLFQISSKEFFARINTDDLLKYLKRQSESKKNLLNTWENNRNNLSRIFFCQEKEEEKEDFVVKSVRKMRLRNCVSEKKVRIDSRNASRVVLDAIACETQRSNGLPELIRARSNPKASKGVSLVSMNGFPVLQGIWSKVGRKPS